MAEWSEGRKKAFIIAALRSATRRYPPKFQTLKDAATEKKINVKTGRIAQHYECNICKGEFPAKEMNIDHIVPAVDPKTGFTTWDDFVERLFCPKENLQAVCVPCHTTKTKGEREFAKGERQSKSTLPKKPRKAPSRSKEL